MRKLLPLFLALALAAPAFAQGQRTAHFAIGYDVASATMTYCRMLGERSDPWAEPARVPIPIETSGSSTTVTAVTALSAPFAALAVGDAIIVQRTDNARDLRWITAKTSDDEVTVNAAADWSAGYTFQWLDLECGTDAAAGWIRVSSRATVTMTVAYEAGDLGALQFVFEGRDGSLLAQPIQLFPGASSECGFGTLATDACAFASTGLEMAYKVTSNSFSDVRVGLRHDGTDGATREAVHAILSVRDAQ